MFVNDLNQGNPKMEKTHQNHMVKQPFGQRLKSFFVMSPDEKETAQLVDRLLYGEREQKSALGKAVDFLRKPTEVQKIGRNTFLHSLFDLARAPIYQMMGVSIEWFCFGAGFQWLQGRVSDSVESSTDISKQKIQDQVNISLVKNIYDTMPEVEQKVKAKQIEQNTERVSSRVCQYTEHRMRMYAQMTGLCLSSVALCAVNPYLLCFGALTPVITRIVSNSREAFEKRFRPHERKAYNDLYTKKEKA